MENQQQPIAVRTEEAARLIGVSKVWLDKTRKSAPERGPRFVQRGRMVLYPVVDLQKWVSGEGA